MAIVGLRKMYLGKYVDTAGTITYTGGANVAAAIKCDISVSNNDVKLFADDILSESETSFNGGTISYQIDDLGKETYALVLGHTYDNTADTVTCKSSDSAPYFGVAFINKTKKGGVAGYRATFLPKVQFAEPSDSFETKGENTTFQTPTLTGNVMQLADETWKKIKYATSEADCITWINTQLGIA